MGMAIVARRYTVEDLEHFPEDGQRYELFEGELFVTPSPGRGHEHIVLRLQKRLWLALGEPEPAWVYAGGAVTRQPRTQFEPDLLVIPTHFSPEVQWADVTDRWLVVEVLSPSTRKLDRTIKRTAYFGLGVRELWLVDPSSRTVEVCTSRTESKTVSDTMEWRVPTVEKIVTIDVQELFA